MDIFYKYALYEVAPDSAAGPDFNEELENFPVKDLKHWDIIQLVTREQQYSIFMGVHFTKWACILFIINVSTTL